MGVSGGKNSSSSKSNSTSTSKTVETGLSTEQLAILQQRQQEYNSTFLPIIKQGLAENTVGSDSYNKKISTLLGNNAASVNASYDTAMTTTQQSLAQQGLSGTSGGAAAALKAQNERARASSLATAYNSIQQSADETTEANRQKYLEMGLSMSPTATTAAPVGVDSETVSTSKGSGSGWNAGLSS